MERSQTDKRLRRALAAIVVVCGGASALDMLNILPGLGARITPLLIGALILSLIALDENLNALRIMARSSVRTLDKLARPLPQTPAHSPQSRAAASSKYREFPWHGLVLRSRSELKIAKELDRTSALFMAGCKIRLNTEHHRQTREVDFLVYHDGRWGILEVDGPHHVQGAQADRWRDDRFREHGIAVQRFAAADCYQNPKEVVQRFFAELTTTPVDSASPTPDDPH